MACTGGHLPGAKTSGIELGPDCLDPFAVHDAKPFRVADGVDDLAKGFMGVHVHLGQEHFETSNDACLFWMEGFESLDDVSNVAAELSRARWVFAFALVTSLFFTWGFAYGVRPPSLIPPPATDSDSSFHDIQLLDVLNAHFQKVFGISKLQSTLLQLAYFVSMLSFHLMKWI